MTLSDAFDTTMLDELKSLAPDKIAMFVSTALDDMDRHYQAYKLALQSHDVKAIEVQVHSIKSVALQFGAKKLGEISDMLEIAALDDDQGVFDINPIFEAEYQKAIEFFKDYLISA